MDWEKSLFGSNFPGFEITIVEKGHPSLGSEVMWGKCAFLQTDTDGPALICLPLAKSKQEVAHSPPYFALDMVSSDVKVQGFLFCLQL